MVLLLLFDLPANGLRYPRWGGRRNAVRLEKCWGVEKCLESRQNPQRRVHALLGAVELDDSLAEKDTAPFYLDKLGNCLTNSCTQLNFWQWPKKHDLPKRQITESQLTQTKTKLIQRLADKMKTFSTKTLTKEIEPILKTYKINHEQSRRKELLPNWLDQKKRQIITSQN